MAAQPIPLSGIDDKFAAGFPTPETVQQTYDNLDLNRAIQMYRIFYPTVAGFAIISGTTKVGRNRPNKVFGSMDTQPRHVGYTLNSDTPYGAIILDLSIVDGDRTSARTTDRRCVGCESALDTGYGNPGQTPARAASTCSCHPATKVKSLLGTRPPRPQPIATSPPCAHFLLTAMSPVPSSDWYGSKYIR